MVVSLTSSVPVVPSPNGNNSAPWPGPALAAKAMNVSGESASMSEVSGGVSILTT